MNLSPPSWHASCFLYGGPGRASARQSLMTTITLKELQTLVNKTQQIHEASWDERIKEYTVRMRDAAEQACPNEWAKVIYLLCQYAWNDAQELLEP